MKQSLIFYKDWYDVLQDLPDEERLKAYDAVMQYAFEDKVPTNKFVKVTTALMRTTIDRDNNKYDEKCERNRQNVLNRWKKKQEQMNATSENERVRSLRTNTNHTDNDNYNDNDNDNDNEPTNVGDKKEKTSNEVKKKTASTIRRFSKPTVAQVQAYCRERGNGVDAQHFVDFYESKGWLVGKSPMKDWKAAVRTWEQKDGFKPNQQKLGVGEYIEPTTGRRTYGTGIATIPPDAPARPSEQHSWNESTKSWIVL